MDITPKFEIAVVGGGAAGLMAACEAAKTLGSGLVALVEAAPRVGKKLLATGNGRCNITNQSADWALYHGEATLAQKVFESITPAEVLHHFEEMGLTCREEEQGRVYPQNGQASAVLDSLRFSLQKYGVVELCGSATISIEKKKKAFLLHQENGTTIQAHRLILAQGGKASPQISSEQGVSLAAALGHSQTALFPALVQVTVPPALVRALKGVRCPGAVRFLADGHAVKEELGEIQFTERGLSGVCVFQLSRLASEFAALKTVQGKLCANAKIAIDLLPEQSFQEVCDLLRRLALIYPELPARDMLFGVLPKRIGQQVITTALQDKAGEPAGKLKAPVIKAMAAVLKGWEFPVTGTLPWQHAQVMAGGVPLSELWVPSMESRICPGVYMAGEQLNIDGDCGGFNLHWAWISGMAAGRSAAEAAKEDTK